MIYAAIFLISILAAVLAVRCGIIKEKRILVIVFAVEALGALVGAYDYYTGELRFSGVIQRPQTGEGSVTHELSVSANDSTADWKVNVSEKALDKEQKKHLFKMAKREIDASLCKGDESNDSVSEGLNLSDSYAGGLVGASWDFSDPKLISLKGDIDYEYLEANSPSVVYVSARLSCGDEEEIYEFPVNVVMPDASSVSGFGYFLDKELKNADEKEPSEGRINLPERVGDIPISWSKKREYRGAYICGLGLLAGLGIVAGEREEKRRNAIKRQKELSLDYPEIVSAISLYVSAGITVRSAMTRIAEGYSRRLVNGKTKARPGYDVIGVVIRQMQEGVGEESAYGSMGRIAGHKDYSKLGLMLSQNIRHGSAKLASLLEKEEQKAFEERKLAARIMGEEASTRLLIPMIMLLSVVLVILVAPAVFNIQM